MQPDQVAEEKNRQQHKHATQQLHGTRAANPQQQLIDEQRHDGDIDRRCQIIPDRPAGHRGQKQDGYLPAANCTAFPLWFAVREKKPFTQIRRH